MTFLNPTNIKLDTQLTLNCQTNPPTDDAYHEIDLRIQEARKFMSSCVKPGEGIQALSYLLGFNILKLADNLKDENLYNLPDQTIRFNRERNWVLHLDSDDIYIMHLDATTHFKNLIINHHKNQIIPLLTGLSLLGDKLLMSMSPVHKIRQIEESILKDKLLSPLRRIIQDYFCAHHKTDEGRFLSISEGAPELELFPAKSA